MKLVVHELKSDGLIQVITVGHQSLDVTAIRPYLYFHNEASGSLKLQITDENESVVAESAELTIDEIKTAISSQGFDHGYLRFYIAAHLRKNTTYGVRLVGTNGYTFAEGAYVGWCNDFDFRIVDALWSPNVGTNGALLMELWGNDSMLRRVG